MTGDIKSFLMSEILFCRDSLQNNRAAKFDKVLSHIAALDAQLAAADGMAASMAGTRWRSVSVKDWGQVWQIDKEDFDEVLALVNAYRAIRGGA